MPPGCTVRVPAEITSDALASIVIVPVLVEPDGLFRVIPLVTVKLPALLMFALIVLFAPFEPVSEIVAPTEFCRSPLVTVRVIIPDATLFIMMLPSLVSPLVEVTEVPPPVPVQFKESVDPLPTLIELTVTDVFTTVIVPTAVGMTTSSAAVGTDPVDQLAGVTQVPDVPVLQVTVAAKADCE